MTSVKQIDFGHIKHFLRLNNIKLDPIESKNYDTAFDLMKKGGDIKYSDTIILWMMAYNLFNKKVDIPNYAKSEIDDLADNHPDDFAALGELLTLKNKEGRGMFEILSFLGKLVPEKIYKPIDFPLLTKIYGKKFSQALESLGFEKIIDINALILNNINKYDYYPNVTSIWYFGPGSFDFNDKKYGTIYINSGTLAGISKLDKIPFGEEYYYDKYDTELILP